MERAKGSSASACSKPSAYSSDSIAYIECGDYDNAAALKTWFDNNDFQNRRAAATLTSSAQGNPFRTLPKGKEKLAAVVTTYLSVAEPPPREARAQQQQQTPQQIPSVPMPSMPMAMAAAGMMGRGGGGNFRGNMRGGGGMNGMMGMRGGMPGMGMGMGMGAMNAMGGMGMGAMNMGIGGMNMMGGGGFAGGRGIPQGPRGGGMRGGMGTRCRYVCAWNIRLLVCRHGDGAHWSGDGAWRQFRKRRRTLQSCVHAGTSRWGTAVLAARRAQEALPCGRERMSAGSEFF
jgi:hypothetical protein